MFLSEDVDLLRAIGDLRRTVFDLTLQGYVFMLKFLVLFLQQSDFLILFATSLS